MPSRLPEHLRPIVGDTSVPVDGQGRWIDSGYWREIKKVTHWHLIEPREWAIADPARFSQEDMQASRMRSSAGAAWGPHDVRAWRTATLDRLIREYTLSDEMLRQSGLFTAEDRRVAEETCFRMAMLGMDVCWVLAVRGERIVHCSAYAMTAEACSAPH